ncbi:NAD(P)/FAD-dependent oxidoreductase [Kribbella sp. NPDC005582]|uniref:hydroxysqualene dehydroxylase n=1 Tax=Kribbella sp. NPDC005582 TaxID=3156893 RepID=UPI0033B83898
MNRSPRTPTDPRQERLAPPPPIGAPSSPVVVVVGAGIAGLTAAVALAERDVEVHVLEREDYLGGRVGAWPHRLNDGTEITMSRGFHAFFRQYYNLRALLARTDASLSRLTPVEDYPLIDRAGRVDQFRGLPRKPPWNAIAFALRSPTFKLTDLLRLNGRAALPLATVRVPDIYERLDDLSAEQLLDAINFPEPARHLAFEVFSRSFFARPGDLSAAELAVMFHLYFLGSSEGLLFDVPNDTFATALWEPLRDYLVSLGADVRTGTPVQSVERGGDRRYRVHLATGSIDADAVVLATDLGGLRQLVASSPQLGTTTWRDTIAGLRTAPPFFVHRLWLDRPVDAHRPAFLGTGGWGQLDNISVLDRYEGEAQRWARQHGGSVVELHAYAAAPSGTRDYPDLADDLLSMLRTIYPETARATVVDSVSLWRDDCPLFAPGSFTSRPRVTTPDDGIVLAGDGIRVDLPVALMERAATTGLVAANALLSSFGLRGHEVLSVPNRSRIRVLDRFATRS